MAQWLKVHTALAEGLGWVPSTDEDSPQSATPCLLLASAGFRHECDTHTDKTLIHKILLKKIYNFKNAKSPHFSLWLTIFSFVFW